MEVVNTSTTTDPVHMYNYLNTFIMNPFIFVFIALILVAYYAWSPSSSSSGFAMSSDSGNGLGMGGIFGTLILIVIIALLAINALQYFFSINVSAYIQGLFSPITQVDVVVDQGNYQPAPVPEIKIRKQVFNIPGNYYSYNDAKAMCKAYGAKLATYDQIEKAYNRGGEWCNYGWSEGQMALFPTQQQTFNYLQTKPGHEHDCGRPGVNGGYIANPNARFGVNCYGNKPYITDEEAELMRTSPPYPETVEDIEFQKRVDKMREQLPNILVSPFNKTRWGEIL